MCKLRVAAQAACDYQLWGSTASSSCMAPNIVKQLVHGTGH